MTKVEQCLSIMDREGLKSMDELMRRVKCSSTIAHFSIQAYKHYRGGQDE